MFTADTTNNRWCSTNSLFIQPQKEANPTPFVIYAKTPHFGRFYTFLQKAHFAE